MDDQAEDRQEWWAYAAICVHAFVLMNISAVLLLERAELSGGYGNGVFVGNSTVWDFSQFVARFEAAVAFILAPVTTSLCASQMHSSPRVKWAVAAAILLSALHFALLLFALKLI